MLRNKPWQGDILGHFLFIQSSYKSLNRKTFWLPWFCSYSLMLNIQLIANCQPTKKDTMACGYCCLVSGVFLYWLPIGLKILIVSLGEKTHTQKKTFSFPTDFFSACVRIKWNYVRESTLYTVPYQCKMLRCVVISLITYLFRMEFPMHCCS